MDWYAFGFLVTLFGVVVTLVLGLFNLWYTFQNNKRTTYINSVTAERVKWINALRENLSKFTGLVFHYAAVAQKENAAAPQWDELMRNADQLRMLIKLQLNPEGDPDQKIEALLDRMYTPGAVESPQQMHDLVHEVIRLAQQLLKKEWEKVKEESKHGDLRDQGGCSCRC